MSTLIFLIYIISSLLLLLLALLFFILLIPFRYYVAGGYKNQPWIRFSLRCSSAFIVAGTWDEEESKLLQTRFILLGIRINIDPQKFIKMKKEKDKETKRGRKKKGFSLAQLILDKDLRTRGVALIQNLFRILKPDHLYLKGEFGFDEPHLTGWLAAFTHGLGYCCKNTFIKLKPIWESEYYEFEAIFNGRIRIGLILIKIVWFLIKLKTRQLFTSSERKEPVTSN